jgi:two-component system sensor histidine kinase KdpD
MLEEGHRLRSAGRDVVIGYVEAHGRADTEAMVRDLEVVPRTRVEYRGSTFEEMDLDAVLARDPDVVLVDELAHTNIPGLANP